MEPSRVVGVQVGQHHPAHLAGIQPAIFELWTDLLLWLDSFLYAAPVVRVPAGEVARVGDAGRLPGIDDDEPFRVLDDPGVNRQPIAPGDAGVGAQQPQRPVAFASDLVGPDADATRLDRMDANAACRRRPGIRGCRVRGSHHDLLLSIAPGTAVSGAALGSSLEEETRRDSLFEDTLTSSVSAEVSLR